MNPLPRLRTAAILTAALILLSGCADEPTVPVVQMPDSPADAEDTLPYLAVLGTAQDGGLPHAACSCPHCESARLDATRARAVSSLALVLPALDRVLLFDATPDIRLQLDRVAALRTRPNGRVDRAPVDAVFLTHAHLGHYTGLGFFGKEAVHTRRLPVHGSSAMVRFLRGHAPWNLLVDQENILPTPFEFGEPVPVGEGVSITAFAVPHRDEIADTAAFIIRGPRRAVLFVPDTDGWQAWLPSLEERVAEVDVALLDGTFHSLDELPGRDLSSITHPLVETTAGRLEPQVQAGDLEVWFTHLNHSNPLNDPTSPERRDLEARGFGVLADGQRLPI